MRVVPVSPANRQASHASKRQTRRGYTLLEMVISTGAATVLLGGLMSTIVVANRAWSPDLKPAIKTETSGLTRQLGIDLKSALYFTERTSTAATFAVPDRDSDGQPEILRYSWSGTGGDALTVSLNGGTAQVVVADVQTFNMDFLLRSVIAPVIPVSGQNRSIVFVSELDGGKGGVVDRSNLTKEDQERVGVIESWGFTVAVISGYASDDEWATQIDKAAAIYVPGSVSAPEISKRLYPTNVGTVFEYSSQRDESVYATRWDSTSGTAIDLENTYHYITQTLPPGDVPIVTSSQPLLALSPTMGPDFEVLARSTASTYTASLAVMETGARTSNSDLAAARRVFLPWGASSTSFSQLTTSALTIMERSISWAAQLDDAAVRRRVLYFVENMTTYDTRDFDRKIMFESAGLEVRLLSQTTEPGTLADEIANSSAVYLTIRASTDLLLSAVKDVPQGVITEGLDWMTPLGFSSGLDKQSVTTLNIKESTHPILAGITGDTVTVLNINFVPVVPGGTLAAGALTILETSGKGKGSATPAVVVIETGNQRIDGTSSPGRRTVIPYYSTRRSDFTANGYQIMQQAMDWTASQPEPVAVKSSSSSSFSKFLQSFSQ